MHVWPRLKKASQGRTGIDLYPDGMVEHDDHVGQKIEENTIVVYTVDYGSHYDEWPNGGIFFSSAARRTSTERAITGCPLIINSVVIFEN